jgi:diguanylate cyclase (GGDEF)-like protein
MQPRQFDISEGDFQAHYQKSDRLQVKRVLKLSMWFYFPLLMLEYALIENRLQFFLLLILKIGAISYSIWLTSQTKKLVDSGRFAHHILVWASIFLFLQLLSNFFMPKNYLGHYLIDAWLCVIVPIIIPLNQRLLRQLLIGFLVASLALVFLKVFPNDVYKLTTLGFMLIASYSGFAIASSIKQYRRAILKAERRIDYHASTDPLTGVANRREFLRLTDCELQRSIRLKKPLSLMVLDVNDFHEINVQHGVISGDMVLKEVSRRLHRVTRNYDLLARYGTEEFGLLLPEATEEVVARIAARSVANINGVPVAASGKELKISAVVGYTTMKEGDTLDTMVRRVDEALLNARNAYEQHKHHQQQEALTVVFA